MSTDSQTVGVPVDPSPQLGSPALTPPRRRRAWSRYTLPALLVIIVVFFSVAPATSVSFPTSANIDAVIASNAVLAVCAMALLCPLIAGEFDLSVGANVGLASIAVAALFSHGQSLVIALLGGIAVAMFVGAVNGFLVAKIGVSSFITTLGMTTVISGAVLAYTDGQSILDGIPSSMTSLSSEKFLGVPRVATLVAIVALIVWYVLSFTPFGRSLRAVGSNASAARLVGFNVRRVTFLSFVISGLVAGIGGALLVAQAGGANPQAGPGYLLPAFAAVFLGATVSRTSGFNVGGTVIAVLFVSVSVSGLVLAGVHPWVEQVFQGTVLILAVTISTLTRKRTEGVPV
ncbi:ABC transporter permease [soil metagenome]